MRARRLTSKMRDRSATAGWTCRDAVVCMVLPRSVVESEEEYQPVVDKSQQPVVGNCVGVKRPVFSKRS